MKPMWNFSTPVPFLALNRGLQSCSQSAIHPAAFVYKYRLNFVHLKIYRKPQPFGLAEKQGKDSWIQFCHIRSEFGTEISAMGKYSPGNWKKPLGAPLQLPPPAPPPAADLQVLVQGSVSCEQLHLQRRLFLIFYHLSTKHKFFSDVKPPCVHMWCAVYLIVSEMGAQLIASFIV